MVTSLSKCCDRDVFAPAICRGFIIAGKYLKHILMAFNPYVILFILELGILDPLTSIQTVIAGNSIADGSHYHIIKCSFIPK